MMEAPTKEMAIGMKMSALGSDSRFIRSSSSASVRPSAVEKIGVMMIHSTVLNRNCLLSGVVKIQV